MRLGKDGFFSTVAGFPLYGLAGALLVAISWILNWSLPGLRTHLGFFPLWLGYCLTVDALVRYRSGTSLLSRDPRGYVLLFLLSAPVWWLFEGLNLVTQNWHYLGREYFSDLQYFLFATLSFSTVIPAVFGTAELLGTFRWTSHIRWQRSFDLRRGDYWKLHAAGWVMLALLLVFPRLFFPLLWLSLFFILDPLNALRGRWSLIAQLARGEGRNLVLYGLGALACGLFWELWNFYSYPKWVYTIPYLDYLRVFEMPLAGYGGYIPFGWELYALYQLLAKR
jgi:hypothetical protein